MSNQSVDDLIMQLMSMGFDFPDCQEAVQTGHMSVETAVEWLLAGKPQATSSAPRLNLRPQQQSTSAENAEGTSNPFVNPITLSLDSSNQSQSDDKKEEISQSESSVTSRMCLNEEQLKVKKNFEAKQRDEARMTALKDKQRRKRDHERILKEIAEDRERKKLTTGSVTVETKLRETTLPDSSPVSGPPEKKNHQDKCTIQLRMPDGKVIRQVYSGSSKFRVVMTDVLKYSSASLQIKLIQPFPHREFGEADMDTSLEDLGLIPSASLTVKQGEAQQAVSGASVNVSTSASSSMLNNESLPSGVGPPIHLPQQGPNHGGSHLPQVGSGLGGHPPPQPGYGQAGIPPPDLGQGQGGGPLPHLGPVLGQNLLPHVGQAMDGGPPQHAVYNNPQNWGPGHRMDVEEEDNEDVEDDGDDPVMGGAMAMGGPLAGGHNFQHFQPYDDEAFGGTGQRLVPEGHPQANNYHHNKPASQVVAEKTQERYSKPRDAVPVEQPEELQTLTLTYSVSSLLKLCMHHVANRLTHHNPKHPLLSLSGLSEDLAQKLLFYLLREKLLKHKTLNAFIPCCLRKLILDCYPYTTNELLHVVRYHHRLQTLSLQSCSLITDAGIQNIAGLKKLKHLNLSCCRQITNKSFSAISEMKSLTSLNLEDTGITEAGVIHFLSNCSRNLQHLNLNRTSVTHNLIHHLKCLPVLKTLCLEQTQVCGLSGVEELSTLHSLDLAHTNIVTDSLLCLPPSLTCLSISHTQKVNGDNALEYLKNMKLQALNLPSRHSTTDIGLQYIIGMPLSVLDLTNYINVGDLGMQYIGQIKTLKKLLLSNTKITDEGCLYLEGLKNLEVLYLDRTSIGDEGATVISGFTALQELSLSSTNVTDGFLRNHTLDPCYYMSKLNLSRTKVSNKGVSCIKSDTLLLLNLDGTCITTAIEVQLRANCHDLKTVTMLNLIQRSSDSDDE